MFHLREHGFDKLADTVVGRCGLGDVAAEGGEKLLDERDAALGRRVLEFQPGLVDRFAGEVADAGGQVLVQDRRAGGGED